MNGSLTDAGREELALALILLKDFKTDGRFDPAVVIQITRLAEHIGVLTEFNRLLSQVPPMKVIPRY